MKSPFHTYESDYGKLTPVERLRQIEPSGIDRYGREVPPPQSAEQVVSGAQTIRRRFDGLERAELTLEECRASALQRNLDLQVALVDPEIARTSVDEEEAAWESLLGVSYRHADLDSAVASDLSSATQQFDSFTPTVTIPNRLGGNVTVGLPITRNENDNPFTTLNPAYTTDFEISLTQQLLRGAGRRSNTHALRVASYNNQISEALTKLEVIRQLAAVDRAYWRLFAARQQLEVAQRQFELAQAQLETAERGVNVGRLAEIEIVRSRAGVAERLEAIIVAQNNVLATQRELKRIINMEGLEQGTSIMVLPASPPDPVLYELDGEALAAAAMDQRMEMLELELRLAQDASQIDFAKNQSLPLVTLDYVYRVNGLGDSINSSSRVMRDNNFEDWELGLRAEVPIGNEAAKARVRRAILTRLQRLATREARRAAITQEVLDAVDTINAGWQRIMAARQSVLLNQRALEAEQRAFGVGNSTSTDVLDAATRLADAQLAEIQAVVEYQVAQVDLAFATGTLLGASRVRWDPGEPNPRVIPLNDPATVATPPVAPKQEVVEEPAPDAPTLPLEPAGDPRTLPPDPEPDVPPPTEPER